MSEHPRASLDLDHVDPAQLRRGGGAKWSQYPENVIPAWVAEMDFRVAEPIRAALAEALDSSALGYPLAPAHTGLPAAFRQRMAERFGWQPDPRRVELLSEVVQGIFMAIEAYSEPGDGVVVQTPIYPPFLRAVAETQRRLVENRLHPGETRFEIDFDALAAAVDARTRVFLLCNPHNPSGRVFGQAELERIGELALSRDLVVVADEIHADLVYAPHRHIPFATLDAEVAARTVTLTSATKSFNIPGLRCAVAHFGTRELQRRFDAATLEGLRGGLGSLGVIATLAAWRDGQPWLDEVLAHLDGNRRDVQRFLAERLPGVVGYEPEATYLQWLDFTQCALPGAASYFLLKRAEVALSDGRGFGAGFDACARLNFATSRALLGEVLERTASAIERA